MIPAPSFKQPQRRMGREETICVFQALPKQQNHEQINVVVLYATQLWDGHSETDNLNKKKTFCFRFQLLTRFEQIPGVEHCQVLGATGLPLPSHQDLSPMRPGCFISPRFQSLFLKPQNISKLSVDFSASFFGGAGDGGSVVAWT